MKGTDELPKRGIPSTIEKVVPLACPVLAGLFILHSTLVQLGTFSIYHDEIWNYPAAVAMLEQDPWVPSQEVDFLGQPIPLVTGPYQGAAKSWISIPVLGFLGTSPLVLRGFNALLSLLFLASSAWALRAALSRVAARAVFLLPLLDPNLLAYIPTDQGPFLLQSIFLSLALGFLLRLVKVGNFRQLAFLVLLLGATLADKLTSVPTVSAIALLSVILLSSSISPLLNKWKGLVLVLVFSAPLLPQILYFLENGFRGLLGMTRVLERSFPPYFEGLGQNLEYFLFEFLCGGKIFESFTELMFHHTPVPWFSVLGIFLLLAAPVCDLITGRWKSGEGKQRLLFPLIFLASLFLFSAVPGLHRPWHYFLLYPPFVLGFFLNGHFLAGLVFKRSNGALSSWGPKALFSGLLAALLVQGIPRGFHALRFLEEGGGINLTSYALYGVEELLRERKARKLITLNYSLANPLYVLLEGGVRTEDWTWTELTDKKAEELETRLGEPGVYAVFRHSVDAPGVTPEYLEWLNKGSVWLKNQNVFSSPEFEKISILGRRGTEFGLLFKK